LRQVCAAFAGHLLYDAEVLTSEIVSNVVKHVGGMLTVAIQCDERNVAVAVADESPARPLQRRRPAGDDIGGRGMQIVHRLAAEWGCHPVSEGEGKVVWFRVAA
jgi:anti-sigma regulatory factor (Ser/Thr protein kinase)